MSYITTMETLKHLGFLPYGYNEERLQWQTPLR